jgi:GNAT superfamily N-acetyltransferase
MIVLDKFGEIWSTFYFEGKPFLKRRDIEIYINDSLNKDEDLTVITYSNRLTRVSLTSEMSTTIGLNEQSKIYNLASFRSFLIKNRIQLHTPDKVYFLSKKRQNVSLNPNLTIRTLTDRDREIFSRFANKIDPEELDNAYVELDHWAVYGLFIADILIASCSLYPWRETINADIGVVTLQNYRGNGFAKLLVSYAYEQISKKGYILQYRTQKDNLPSIKLAESLELSFFGEWQPIIAASLRT